MCECECECECEASVFGKARGLVTQSHCMRPIPHLKKELQLKGKAER